MRREITDVPKYDLVFILMEMRNQGESLLDTAKRILTLAALAKTMGHQQEAAELLFITPRAMNSWCADLQIRPIDKKRVRLKKKDDGK